MNSADLSAEQLEALSQKAASMLWYLVRLRERMDRRGFPIDDALYTLVREAEDRMHHLRVDLHYRTIDAERNARGEGGLRK